MRLAVVKDVDGVGEVATIDASAEAGVGSDEVTELADRTDSMVNGPKGIVTLHSLLAEELER